MRKRIASLSKVKGWPECIFPSLEHCGYSVVQLLAAVECIISLVSNSTPIQSFHNFTITWNNLELVCYGTVLEVWIQITGFDSGLINSIYPGWV